MDKDEIIKIVRRYAEALTEFIKPKKVFLYGSYAKDTAKIESDIDVAVVVDHLDKDFLDTEVMLYRVRRGVDDRIEPVLINENNDKSGFLEHIKKYGVLVYG